MSLLSDAMEKCQMLDKTSRSDGYGGVITVWTLGAKFEAAVALDTSLSAQTALSEGVTAVYSVVTRKSVNLQFHDVFKRLSDGKVFRVKSDGDDSKTPDSAGLDMRVVRAEEWSVTEDAGAD